MSSCLRKICGLAAVLLVMPVFVEAYTITYNLNGGVNNPDNPTSYVSDTSKLELKAPSRDGAAFLGWYINSYQIGEEINYVRSTFARYQNKKKNYIANNLGNFSVTARWGLIPQTPKQDERGCYLIHDGAELYGLASVADWNSSTYAYDFNGCVSLQNDIVVNKSLLDAKGEIALDNYLWWIPLNFNGTFDGNGYKISGLRGDDGFFLKLGDYLTNARPAYVRNLGITDSYFSSSTAGALAGTIYNSARISNVYTDASVHGDYKAGGLVGEIYTRYESCLTLLPARIAPAYAKSQDDLDEAFIENAYSLGHVEGEKAGGIAANVTLAILRNVYFAGELKGKYTDCILANQKDNCLAGRGTFALENALCMDSKETSTSKATSLSKAQFADGTALKALSEGENGQVWKQGPAYPVFDNDIRFEIQYVMNGGKNDESNPTSFTKNDKSFALKNPVKDGDEFEGWFFDDNFTRKADSVKTDLYGSWTLYAKWKSFFFINIDLNGGNRYRGDPVYPPDSLRVRWASDSATYVLADPAKKWYEFDGWFTDTLFKNKITEIPAGNTEDVTVHAKWNVKEYKITYHLNGGTNHADNPTTFTVQDTGFVFKEPTREGADFYGWTETMWGDYLRTKIEAPGDTVFFAQWMPALQEPQKDSKGCYLITTKEELYWFAKLANSTLDGVLLDPAPCAFLQNDIVVNENVLKNLNPYPQEGYFIWFSIQHFEGTFTGNGHSISGLVVRDNGNENEFRKYGGLFSVVQGGRVTDVMVDDTYVERYGAVEHLVITGKDDYWGALPNVAAKSDWRTAVQGNRVVMSGLKPGKTLLVMDVQGRVLQKLQTEPSMVIDLSKAGTFLVRYGNETHAFSVR